MKILITGGKGYIAKSITNTLWDRYHILSPGKDELDLTNRKSVDKFFKNKQFDVVIHTAIKGGSRLNEDDQTVLLDNIIMMTNLHSHQDKYAKLINLGSGAEIYAPETPYGASKKWCNELVNEIKNWYTIRIYGVFDENELDTRFIKTSIKSYIAGEPIIIHQDKLMDFFYMKDLVSLIEFYILNNNLDKEIDCCYNDTMALSGVASIINNLSYWTVPVNYNNLKPTNPYIGKITELPIKVLGLEQGIKNVFEELK
jgi:nucleoside-diphosphate-sugar epimerase